MADQEHVIHLDYPVWPRPRYGHGRPPHGRLYELINSRRRHYGSVLQSLIRHREALAKIPLHEHGLDPSWINGWIPGLDTAALYSFVMERNPEWYIEVGSGHSTRVVRRAIEDGDLRTQVISIDPQPRADCDELCDIVVREPLENADLSVFDRLGRDDIVYLDGSHRVFMNSDVTVFFLEVLPDLPKGILVQLHDVMLPYDYLPSWGDRYYSEQYVLAAYLLGGARNVRIHLPARFVSEDPDLASVLDPLWADPVFEPVEKHGDSFWMEITR